MHVAAYHLLGLRGNLGNAEISVLTISLRRHTDALSLKHDIFAYQVGDCEVVQTNDVEHWLKRRNPPISPDEVEEIMTRFGRMKDMQPFTKLFPPRIYLANCLFFVPASEGFGRANGMPAPSTVVEMKGEKWVKSIKSPLRFFKDHVDKGAWFSLEDVKNGKRPWCNYNAWGYVHSLN
jgi:hypothetical protein